MCAPAELDDQMVFSDEEPSSAVDAGKLTLPLWAVAEEADVGSRALAQVRDWARAQQERWRELDRAWRPVLLALVRLQNRYLPELTRRTTLLFDPDTGERIDPIEQEREAFDAAASSSTTSARTETGCWPATTSSSTAG